LHFLLEQVNSATYSGLGEVQVGTSPGEAAASDYGEKSLDLGDIHAAPIRILHGSKQLNAFDTWGCTA
jgi:hypothetical protein